MITPKMGTVRQPLNRGLLSDRIAAHIITSMVLHLVFFTQSKSMNQAKGHSGRSDDLCLGRMACGLLEVVGDLPDVFQDPRGFNVCAPVTGVPC